MATRWLRLLAALSGALTLAAAAGLWLATSADVLAVAVTEGATWCGPLAIELAGPPLAPQSRVAAGKSSAARPRARVNGAAPLFRC